MFLRIVSYKCKLLSSQDKYHSSSFLKGYNCSNSRFPNPTTFTSQSLNRHHSFIYGCLNIVNSKNKSLSAFLSGILWILLKHNSTELSCDAKDVIKLNATVQVSFILEKLVSQLIPYIERLQDDIFSEIGLPKYKGGYPIHTPKCGT